LKKKSNSKTTQVSSEKIYYIHRHGIKVYPVSIRGSWFIQIDNNGKVQRFDKKVPQNDLNDAIAKTIIYFYNKLIEKENGKQ
jgi:hypothetical protein